MNVRLISAVAIALGLTISQVLPTMADQACDPTVDFVTLARTQYDAGEFTSSFESYSCALTLDADSATAFLGRGNAARNLGNYTQAVDDYSDALEVRDDLAIAYNNRGWAYYNLTEYDEALADYNQALQIDPDLAYAYNNRGLIYQMQGQNTLAEADFNRALQLGAEATPWAQHNLSNLNGSSSTSADSTALPVTTITEPTLDALLQDAAQAWHTNQWERTIELATAVLERDPQNVNALIYRADSLYVVDRFEEALQDFNQAIELYPDNAYALDGRAYTLSYLGDFSGARADYEAALALQPGHVNNHLTLGTIESVSGNAEAAGVEFLAALEMLEEERVNHTPAQIGDSFSVQMAEGLVYAVTIEAEAGQIVTFDSHSDVADPLLVLLNPEGNPIAGDDDSCNKLDAMLTQVELPADGTYTLLIGHAGGGSEGAIDISLIDHTPEV